VLPHRPDVNIEGSSLSAKYLIVNERLNATTRVVVHRLPPGAPLPKGPLGDGEVISFNEAVYDISGREWLGLFGVGTLSTRRATIEDGEPEGQRGPAATPGPSTGPNLS
jgi:hypothetical protein